MLIRTSKDSVILDAKLTLDQFERFAAVCQAAGVNFREGCNLALDEFIARRERDEDLSIAGGFYREHRLGWMPEYEDLAGNIARAKTDDLSRWQYANYLVADMRAKCIDVQQSTFDEFARSVFRILKAGATR